MKVKCISKNYSLIKHGEVFEVKFEGEDYYDIISPYGTLVYKKVNFEIVMTPKEKLQEAQNTLENLRQECEKLSKEISVLKQEIKDSASPEMGDRYVKTGGCEYIVARLDSDLYALINLQDGNRWSNPTSNILDIFAGSEKQFKKKI